ncbi:MAG: HD domain-containing protein, partial [Thermodesulfobacteriota bacterium]
MVRLEDILEKVASYNPQADFDIIRKAYVFSGMVHKGQHRLSGEPYLSHPLEVADILTSLRMDASCVATGLLHDTVEDTHTTIEKIEEVFGGEVSSLVEGLTKISKISFETKVDQEAENFRKMLLAMARDIRIIIIKLADRLHNMRTLEALSRDRQIKIARETMEIYAPIANRIGINWMKAELEDLAFKFLEPDNYKYFKEKIQKSGREREAQMDTIKNEIEKTLKEHKIKGTVLGRPKHIYSIYKKMTDQDLDLVDIHDVVGFRIIVDSVKDCYIVLGVIHSTWKPLPGRFKDYIGIPKPNLYQSLHTTVIGPESERMEV